MIGCWYRITAFGTPRTPWRATVAEAHRDAALVDLAEWDDMRQSYWLHGAANLQSINAREKPDDPPHIRRLRRFDAHRLEI